MPVLAILAALGASTGWATGIVLAQTPAQRLGAFTFTRIQLLSSALLLAAVTTVFGLWQTVAAAHWPAFAISSAIGIVVGNLAMIACLRRGGPRRTELLLTLKAPIVAAMAFVFWGETLSIGALIGAGMVLLGVALAIGGHETGDESPGPLGPILLLGLTAATCHGIGFLALKPAIVDGLSPIAASAVRLGAAAAIVSTIALWPSPRFDPPEKLTPPLLGRTILPGLIGYGVASSLLMYAMARMDSGLAVVLGSLSPVMVIPILWGIRGVRPHPMALVGAAVAVAGGAVILLT